MTKLSKLLALILVAGMLISPTLTYADSEETAEWTLDAEVSCSKIKVSLPLPELDATCDLDKSSGNPSKWFNPLATCELDFDMIGLPSLGDIMGGIAGSVCNAIKEVKSKTIDQAINEINQDIPNNLFENINRSINVNDEVRDSLESSGSSNSSGSSTPDSNLCYTNDLHGNTITVPCDITDPLAQNPDQCYLANGTNFDNLTPVNCSRPTVNQEQCVTGYERDEYGRIKHYADGVPIPITGSCGNTSLSARTNACLQSVNNQGSSSTRIVSCEEISQPITQATRLCEGTRLNDSGSFDQVQRCLDVELACYGHMDGVFKAAQCRDFSLRANVSTNRSSPSSLSSSDPYADFTW